jgi:hypothetical protein
MAIQTILFKAGSPFKGHVALPCPGFLAIVLNDEPRNRKTKKHRP